MTEIINKNTFQSNPKRIFGLICLTLIAVIAFITLFGSDSEHYTASQVNLFLAINHGLTFWPLFWENVTALGDGLILFPLMSILLLTHTRAWAALFGAVPLASILSHFGKTYFSIPRPAAVIDIEQFTIIGEILRRNTSLPSGHTITVFTAATAILCVLLYEKKNQRPLLWGILLMLAATLVAFSRIAVGAHWPTDVLLGATFGTLAGLSGAFLAIQYNTWWQWMAKPKFQWIHALVLTLLCVRMLPEHQHLAIAWLAIGMACFVFTRLYFVKATPAPL